MTYHEYPAQETRELLAKESQECLARGNNVVAYAFLPQLDEQTKTLTSEYAQLFYTASDVRQALLCTTHELQVVIRAGSEGETVPCSDVTPLNLAAALHKDNSLRDIYIEKTNPGGLFVSRTTVAGVRGVISSEDTASLLGVSPPIHAMRPAIAATASECRTGEPALDMAWLEQVLELDELDELSGCSPAALLPKPPVSQSDSLEALEVAPELLLASRQPSEEKGVVAAFVSGRGGVGKSSLTALTGMSLWRTGSKVALLDLDLQFGDISILVGNERESRIQRLSLDQLSRGEILIPCFEGSLLLLEAPPRPEQAEGLLLWIPRLLAALRAVTDIVLVNTACLWDEAAAVLASHADKLVICMDQRATSVSAARQVVDLCVRLQIPSTKLSFLLNRSQKSAPITDIDASLAMGGVDIITIAEGGADVDELLSLGCPLEVLNAQNALRQSIHELGINLLKQPGAKQPSAVVYR
ncbi:MAG: P-loop NTPase [Coriobacteriales bacterium]|jgi:pilus assembly protein CpaE|nr:P-loop NTPase [Coriobacteriales bacterium]